MATKAKKTVAAKSAATENEDVEAGYDKLAKVSWSKIGKEKMLPEGTWRLKIRGAKRMPPKENGSGQLLVFFTPVAPLDDVDADLIAELGEDYDISVNSVVGQFWLSEARDFAQVDALFEKAGIDTEELREADVDFDESLKSLKGREIAAYVKVDNYNPDKPKLVASSYSKLDDVE